MLAARAPHSPPRAPTPDLFALGAAAAPKLPKALAALQHRAGEQSARHEQQQRQQPGQRYRRRRRLRRTIFGDLVEAVDQATGRRVVAKRSLLSLVRAGVSGNGHQVIEDPIGEARLLRELPPHPNVVALAGEHVEDVVVPAPEGSGLPDRADRRHWLVLEHVGGGELFDVVDATHGAGLPLRQARHYFAGLARAVRHLHRHGVAHLDVSLENALLDAATNEAILCDFGLAAPAGRAVQLGGDVRPGKDTYMAPEIFRGDAAFDPCLADVWSLGVVLFMMVAGTPPYMRPDASDRRFELVVGGRLGTLVEAWGMADRFDPDLVHLLGRMMCPAESRAGIDEVMASPWMAAALAAPRPATAA